MSDVTDILRLFTRELWLVTAEHDGRRGGLIATFVHEASIVPTMPRMLVGIARHHHTWRLIEASRAFTLRLLDESHVDWVWRFGLQSGHHADKFANFQMQPTIATIECRVETSMDTGDRTIYLGEVLCAQRDKQTSPLTMKRLLELAPPDRLEVLRENLLRDAEIDAAAIAAWRQI